MRARTLVHIAGPVGAGKTTFVERLLDAKIALAICVRAQLDAKRRKEKESAPKNDAELRRYRKAGASAVALYRFAEASTEAFFSSDLMQDYSDAVFIEGDSPLNHVDLSVFIAPAPANGHSLLRRIARDHTAAHNATIALFANAIENPDVLSQLVSAGLGERLGALALKHPSALDDLRRSVESKLVEIRRASPPAPTEHWALEEGYAGIEHAQLVVVNVRSDVDVRAAKSVVVDVARLRKDEEVYRDVIGFRGNRLPVTAVIADLSNPKDAGITKAVARVKRAMKRKSIC